MSSTPSVHEPRAPRPWVQIAAFCTTALTENTGALSIIRITDRLTVAGVTPEMQPQPVQLTMAIVLKSDEMRGQYQVRVRSITPRGVATDGPELAFLFEGEDRGVQAILPMGFLAVETGLYWFEVMIEGELLTRVPLRVLYQRIQLPPGVQWPGSMPPGNPGANPQQ